MTGKKCKCPFCETELIFKCVTPAFCENCAITFIKCDKCGNLFNDKLTVCPKCGDKKCKTK